MEPQDQELLDARYGKGRTPENVIFNDQVRGLLSHRTVRTFLPEPLPEGALETMVAAAQSASASSNLHQWSVVAVTNPDLKKQLQHLARSESMGHAEQPYIAETATVLLWVADMSRNQAITEAHGGDTEVFEHLDSFLMSSVDAALAAQNAAVAAESIGLGFCYLGSLRNHAKELAELVNLPHLSYVAFGMAVGVPDQNRPSDIRPRPSQSVVLHHNRYEAAPLEQWLDGYEETFQEFRTRNQMKPKTWLESVTYASTKPYMDGRENLRETVQDRGYLLR